MALTRRSFADHFEAMCGRRPDFRRLRRAVLLPLGALAALATGGASADWKVYDDDVERAVQEVRDRIGDARDGTVNGHLDRLNHRLDVKGEVYDPEAAGTGADDRGNATRLADAPAFPDNDALSGGGTIAGRRCGNAKTPDDQRAACEQIVRLEGERYQYLQAMRTISARRSAELKKIADERRTIAEDEFGKLESNTNRLLALLSQQRIDDLNLQMAMATYDQRIQERKDYSNYLAEVAMDPARKQGLDFNDLLGGYARSEILDAALQLAGERRR